MMLLSSCEDKAQPAYARCVSDEAKGDLIVAALDCETAIKADPNSTSGKAAAEKLAAMQPALAKAKAEQTEKDAKAAEDRRTAEAARQRESPVPARPNARRTFPNFTGV